MDELKSKLSEGNYEEALGLYEELIGSTKQRHSNETFELWFGKTQTLILLCRFKESLGSLQKAITISEMDGSHVSNFIDNLVKTLCCFQTASQHSSSCRYKCFTCCVCKGMPVEPTTLSCGHSICLVCKPKLVNKACQVCHKQNGVGGMKINVLLQELIFKYFKNDYNACQKRLEGNALLKDGKKEQALQKYIEGLALDPNDAPLNSNIAFIMIQNGKFDKGLEYANVVCKVQPDWAKGYYRKGSALIGLGRRPEAAFAFLQCIANDQANSPVRKLLTEVMKEIFNVRETTENEMVDKLPLLADLLELFEKFKENVTQDKLTGHDGCNIKAANGNLKWDAQDVECTLCCRLFYKPVTTPCGHVFCKNCLNRSLDHRPDCPICRSSLSQVLALRNQNTTEAIEQLMQTHLAEEYEERKKVHLAEMEKLASVASNTEEDIPIFVCTMAFPTLACPLHIFEPRYRLMVRQCVESGSKQFGMCAYDEDKEFAEYGTMLVILDVQFLPDGRSLVNTIGGRRFKVLSKGRRDGYSIAKVEWITDEEDVEDKAEVKDLLREVFSEANSWFNMLPLLLRRRIVNSVSEMPRWEEDAEKLPNGPEWLWWLITVCPLDPKAQLTMLGSKSLKHRLLTMKRVLAALS